MSYVNHKFENSQKISKFASHPKTPYSWSDRRLYLELDFEEAEYERRIAGATALMQQNGLDALLVYEYGQDASNTRYLTGFATAPTWIGGSLTLLRADGEIVLATSTVAHGEPMHSNVQTAWVETLVGLNSSHPDAFAAVVSDVLSAWSSRRIGVHRPEAMPHGLIRRLEALDGRSLVEASEILPALRIVKSSAEIAVLRELGRITAAGMGAAVDAVKEGVSESAIAAAAHQACVAAGAELMTFGCFAATGPRSSLKNVASGPQRLVKPGDVTMIDLGCKLKGYQSDMSRNVVVGDVAPALAAMLESCERALETGKRAARVGALDIEVVDAVRDAIAADGFADDDYTICHSCGLDLVEEPRFDRNSPRRLQAGMSFYIEPMIIPPPVGSICIEDMVLVTDAGCETLTELPTRFWA